MMIRKTIELVYNLYKNGVSTMIIKTYGEITIKWQTNSIVEYTIEVSHEQITRLTVAYDNNYFRLIWHSIS